MVREVKIRLLRGRPRNSVMDHQMLLSSFRMLMQRRILIRPTVWALLRVLLMRMVLMMVMQFRWILNAAVNVLVSVIDGHVAVLQSRVALAGVDGRHLVTVRIVMAVAAGVSGRVRSGRVAAWDVLTVSVGHFPVQFRFVVGLFVHHGVHRKRMRQRPFRAQQRVGGSRTVGLVPQAVAGRVDVADVMLTRSRIRQVVADLWPEIAFAPADENGRTEEETQFRIGLIVGPRSEENSHQMGPRTTQESSQGSAHFGSGPLGFDERLRNDQDDAATGSQSQSERISSRIVAAIAACGMSGEISVLKAETERGSSFGRVFQFRCQNLRHELLVFQAVTDKSVKHRLLAAGRRNASVQFFRFRIAEADSIARKDPNANRLAVDEHQDDGNDAQQKEANSGSHDGNVIHDGSAAETCHDADGRICRAAAIKLVEANQLLVAHQTMK